MLVQMELSRILIQELDDCQLIELREIRDPEAQEEIQDADAQGLPEAGLPQSEPRCFPIVIGLPEAMAIQRRLKGITIKRPQTHDLLASAIKQLGGDLESITINDLNEHTFFATLDVRQNGNLIHIDARPSDAIALGVASGAPIFVADHVIDDAMSGGDLE